MLNSCFGKEKKRGKSNEEGENKLFLFLWVGKRFLVGWGNFVQFLFQEMLAENIFQKMLFLINCE